MIQRTAANQFTGFYERVLDHSNTWSKIDSLPNRKRILFWNFTKILRTLTQTTERLFFQMKTDVFELLFAAKFPGNCRQLQNEAKKTKTYAIVKKIIQNSVRSRYICSFGAVLVIRVQDTSLISCHVWQYSYLVMSGSTQMSHKSMTVWFRTGEVWTCIAFSVWPILSYVAAC